MDLFINKLRRDFLKDVYFLGTLFIDPSERAFSIKWSNSFSFWVRLRFKMIFCTFSYIRVNKIISWEVYKSDSNFFVRFYKKGFKKKDAEIFVFVFTFDDCIQKFSNLEWAVLNTSGESLARRGKHSANFS